MPAVRAAGFFVAYSASQGARRVATFNARDSHASKRANSVQSHLSIAECCMTSKPPTIASS